MQDNIAALCDILQNLHKQEPPSKSQLRQMAKSLGVPQRNIDVPTLFENIQHAFLQAVESLREGSGGDHLVVRQILRDVLELGRLPKEVKNPKTAAEIAEKKLAKQVTYQHLRERAQEALDASKGRCDLDSQFASSSGAQHPCLSAERDLLLSGTATRLISDIGPYINHRSPRRSPRVNPAAFYQISVNV